MSSAGQLCRAVLSLPGRGLIALVRGYQRTFSHWLGGQCRFTPSCSEYFIQAVRTRGAITGTMLGLWRIVRCNPFCKGGYDPVPKGEKPQNL
jgi:putative membrane protein insertion efficiency factor